MSAAAPPLALRRRSRSSGSLREHDRSPSPSTLPAPPAEAPVRGVRYALTYYGNALAGYGLGRALWACGTGARGRAGYAAATVGLTLLPRLNRASYHVLRWPLLVVIYALVAVEFGLYLVLRCLVWTLELAIATPTHRELRAALRAAPSYEAWLASARALDASRGVALWQADLRSTRYNWPFVKGLVVRLRDARRAGDWRAVAVALRLCSRPNVGGVMAPELFSQTHTGFPKVIVTDFVDEVAASVDWLAEAAVAAGDGTEGDALRRTAADLFAAARESYGRTVLSLSGGGALGTYHFGVARALVDAELLPDAICGTSAGAIIAVFLCSRTDAEVRRDLFDDAALVRELKCFERGPVEMARSYVRTGACYDNARWMEIARWFANDSSVKDMTFAEAHARSGRRLAVTVCAKGKRAPPVLLTHLTSPHVTLVSAVVATAAVPHLVAPQVLREKDPETGAVRPQPGGEAYIDGSIVHDIPAGGLREAFNARFVVASQVNPHFQPMLYATHGAAGEPCRWAPRGAAEAGWRGGFVLAALELFLRSDMAAKLQFLCDVDATPGWSGRVFTQSPRGTVTITPALHLRDYFLLFSNPTPTNIHRYTREGRVATYQKLAMLRTRAHVERALADGCAALADLRPAALPGLRRVVPAAGALAWATPSTISEFPDLGADPYDSSADFEDDGL